MSDGRRWRVAVAGATGALGTEVLGALEERRAPVGELRLWAGGRSAGDEVEIRGETVPVRSEPPDLEDVDVLFVCTPPGAALDAVRRALREDVFVVDCTGVLASSGAAPLFVAGVHEPGEIAEASAVSLPPGPALAWILALAPIGRELGLRRVVGTCLEAATRGGRAGVDALSTETVALFNQQDLPEPTVFERPVAFDCVPWIGEPADDGQTEHEHAMAAAVRRVLGEKVGVAVTAVGVPTFCGDGSALAIETERPGSPEAARSALRRGAAVRLWEEDPGPTTRATAGRDVVLVGRVRSDPSRPGGLLLWLAADTLRLVATHAVRTAELRLGGG